MKEVINARLSRRSLLQAMGMAAGTALFAGCIGPVASDGTQSALGPIVQTTRGSVRGTWEKGIAIFRGIPYAEAPVGKLRFKPPLQRQRWEGVRKASDFGFSHPQFTTPNASFTTPVGQEGDDCLNLNVWTPVPGQTKLPVLVWIHGGGLLVGSGSEPGYDGATFAREGIVTVTINYRLGYAGFLYLGERTGSGCFGILDQIAALHWVQENIAAFGGDPANVTVAGESGGSNCISALLGAPAAHGLFHRAILQSGTMLGQVRPEAAAVIGDEVLRRLGMRLSDNDALATITTAELVDIQRAVGPEEMNLLTGQTVTPDLITLAMGTTLYPVYGTDVLPEPALVPIANGATRDIDILVGTNADEYNLFPALFPAMADPVVNMTATLADVVFAPTGRTGAAALEVYRHNRPGASDFAITMAFMTDLGFRILAIRLAETAQRYNRHTYMYRFGWGSPPSNGKAGATHGVEMQFMWDTLGNAAWSRHANLMPDNPPQALATTMHGAWANFVKTGAPQHASLPEWPAYDTERRATMEFDVESRVFEDPAGDERQLWDGVEY